MMNYHAGGVFFRSCLVDITRQHKPCAINLCTKHERNEQRRVHSLTCKTALFTRKYRTCSNYVTREGKTTSDTVVLWPNRPLVYATFTTATNPLPRAHKAKSAEQQLGEGHRVYYQAAEVPGGAIPLAFLSYSLAIHELGLSRSKREA